ncbi:hypothetical protein ABZ890_47515 [Streptomyces sp. NPDC046984]|uniref:hypothetical protein n=1 Tax=Streptomyces sp. NPDC046984 TaxID=3155138 RepID=UPI0034006B72
MADTASPTLIGRPASTDGAGRVRPPERVGYATCAGTAPSAGPAWCGADGGYAGCVLFDDGPAWVPGVTRAAPAKDADDPAVPEPPPTASWRTVNRSQMRAG